MYEAFRKAARQNPQDQVARQVFEASDKLRQERIVERSNRELEDLKKEFKIVGSEWFQVKGNPLRASWQRITEPKVKHKWQNSLRKLVSYQVEDQAVILNEFCLGMGLSEDQPHPAYHRIIDELSTIYRNIELLQRLRGHRGVGFSTVSRMFVDVFKDITGYSDEQKRQMDDFLNARAGLPREKVLLPQTLSAIAHWLQDSRQNS